MSIITASDARTLIRQLTAPHTGPTEDQKVMDYVSSQFFPCRSWLLQSPCSFGFCETARFDSYRAQFTSQLVVAQCDYFVNNGYLRKDAIELGLSQAAHTLVERLLVNSKQTNSYAVLRGLPMISHNVVQRDLQIADDVCANTEHGFGVFAGLQTIVNGVYVVDTSLSKNLRSPVYWNTDSRQPISGGSFVFSFGQ